MKLGKHEFFAVRYVIAEDVVKFICLNCALKSITKTLDSSTTATPGTKQYRDLFVPLWYLYEHVAVHRQLSCGICKEDIYNDESLKALVSVAKLTMSESQFKIWKQQNHIDAFFQSLKIKNELKKVKEKAQKVWDKNEYYSMNHVKAYLTLNDIPTPTTFGGWVLAYINYIFRDF